MLADPEAPAVTEADPRMWTHGCLTPSAKSEDDQKSIGP